MRLNMPFLPGFRLWQAAVVELQNGAAAGMDWGDFGVYFAGALAAGAVGFFAIRFLYGLWN